MLQATQPPKLHLARFSGAVIISDFLDPISETRARIEQLAGDGAAGHLIEVVDPAEETLPYEGRTELLSPDGGQRWVADRVQSLRDRYKERLAAHRAELMETTRRLGWSFLVHHTDRSPAEPLAFVCNASTHKQTVLESTLATAVADAQAAELEPPAIVVVGEVVRLRDGLDWLGALSGKQLVADPMGTESRRDPA